MRDLFLVGTKLLGLSLAITAISNLVGLAMTVAVSYGDKISTTITSMPWIIVLHAAITLTLAWFLMFRADGIAELLRVPDTTLANTLPESTVLFLGIQLMGVWLLATGTIQAVETLTRQASMTHGSATLTWTIVAKVLRMLVGYWMAVHPWMVAATLKMKRPDAHHGSEAPTL